MCRIVVFAKTAPVNPVPVDPKKLPASYQRGDVVRIVEDGVFLGKDVERGWPAEYPGEPWWQVIELPGVPAKDPRLVGLLARDPGNTEMATVTDLGYRTWKRSRHIDLDALGTARNIRQVISSIRSKPETPRSGVVG